MNFRLYVSSLRQLFKNNECNKFVIGNSGADYDSVIGALIYAFYMTTSFKVLHLPLIDCKQADLALRFQISTVLDSLSIGQGQLLYTDMILDLYNNSNNTFLLYDHNVRKQIEQSRISQIIDHHAYDPQQIKCPHIISHCGSALTLLYYLYYPQLLQKFSNTQLYKKYDLYLKKHPQPSKKELLDDSQPIINELLYNGIIIDSYGLSPKQTLVWNQFDKQAIETIKQRIKPRFEFDELGAAKFDEQRNLKLTFEQQKVKDYKGIRYGDILIHYSTILLNIDLFVDRYWKDISQKLSLQKMGKNQVHAFMFSFPISAAKSDIIGGNYRKYILYNSPNKQIVVKLQKIMKDLSFTKQEDVGGWNKWTDPTGRISRKIFDKELTARL